MNTTTNITANLQIAHNASLQLTHELDCKGIPRTKLYIQAIDAYSYQRELIIQLKHRPSSIDDLYWEIHTYRHPGRRNIQEISESAAVNMIMRIIELANNYPSLLFNAKGICAQNDGFVHLTETLLDGTTASVKLFE